MADSARSSPRLERIAVVVLGLYLTGTGLDALARGRWLFTDYLGLRVPSPLAFLAGILLLILGLPRWNPETRSR